MTRTPATVQQLLSVISSTGCWYRVTNKPSWNVCQATSTRIPQTARVSNYQVFIDRQRGHTHTHTHVGMALDPGAARDYTDNGVVLLYDSIGQGLHTVVLIAVVAAVAMLPLSCPTFDSLSLLGLHDKPHGH